MLKTFFCSLAVMVLSVLYVGLLLGAGLSILAGFLRTFGVDQIKMGLWYGVELPVMFSIPFALLIALLLFFCTIYIKRSIVFCLSILRL
ncbi:hypothetical protein [Lysinibacillus capsici]|uniref:hypothetical protein n=1 Tax=Lysinibacillus capsici TaxID=2115968 RepID=UPI0032E530D4